MCVGRDRISAVALLWPTYKDGDVSRTRTTARLVYFDGPVRGVDGTSSIAMLLFSFTDRWLATWLGLALAAGLTQVVLEIPTFQRIPVSTFGALPIVCLVGLAACWAGSLRAIRRRGIGWLAVASAGLGVMMTATLLIPAGLLVLVAMTPTLALALARVIGIARFVMPIGLVGSSALLAAIWADGLRSPLDSWVLLVSNVTAIAVLVAAIFAVWWSTQFVDLFRVAMESQRIREGSHRSVAWLAHDGWLALAEQVASGREFSIEDRKRWGELAGNIRSAVLVGGGEQTATGRLTTFVEQRGRAASVTVSTVANVSGEPPATVVSAFESILGALISNLHHAAVDTALLTIDASESSMNVGFTDDGVGFAATPTWSVATCERLAQLERVGATYTVESRPGQGTTWRFEWRA